MEADLPCFPQKLLCCRESSGGKICGVCSSPFWPERPTRKACLRRAPPESTDSSLLISGLAQRAATLPSPWHLSHPLELQPWAGAPGWAINIPKKLNRQEGGVFWEGQACQSAQSFAQIQALSSSWERLVELLGAGPSCSPQPCLQMLSRGLPAEPGRPLPTRPLQGASGHPRSLPPYYI